MSEQVDNKGASIVVRREHDSVDQLAHHLCALITALRLIERRDQILNLDAIAVRHIRMDQHGGFLHLIQGTHQVGLALLQHDRFVF